MCKKLTIGLADACFSDDSGVMRSYVDAVRRGGHFPLILPATDSYEEVSRQLRNIDVLLLSGGGDIEASLFGAEAGPYDSPPNSMRDAYELLLMQATTVLNKPVFGICRGMQLINVFFGGTLIQDLPTQWTTPDALPAAIGGGVPSPLNDHSRPDKKWEPVHSIRIDSQSRLARTLQIRQAFVNSTHHQAIDCLGRGLKAVAWSEDGVIEALESELYPVAAVQFHPERLAWGKDVLFTQLFRHIDTCLGHWS